MADQKISELAALTGADLAGADEFAVVDTTAAETKRITFTELQAGLDGSEAGLTFPDYATFIADTSTYTAGTVAVLRDTGFRYEAVASGGDVTSAGSQQFEVLPQVAGHIAAPALSSGTFGSDEINNALAVLDGEPGKVVLPGTYDPSAGTGYIPVSSPIVLGAGQVLEGASRGATILRAENSLNDNVIESKDFDTLTGTTAWKTSAGVPWGCGVRNLSINGNKANQTSGQGIAFFAKGYMIENADIFDVFNDAFYSEIGSNSGQEDFTDMPEARISYLRTREAGRYGVHWKGPNDAHFESLFINGRGGATDVGFYAPSGFGSKFSADYIHIYACQRGMELNDLRATISILETEENFEEGLYTRLRALTDTLNIGKLVCFNNLKNNTASKWAVDIDGEVVVDEISGDVNDDGTSGEDFLKATGGRNQIKGGYIDGKGADGVGVDWDCSNSRLECRIARFSDTNGIGLRIGNTAAVSNNRISVETSSCKTHVDVQNQTDRSVVDVISLTDTGESWAAGAITRGTETSWSVRATGSGTVRTKRTVSAAVAVDAVAQVTKNFTIDLPFAPSVGEVTCTLERDDSVSDYEIGYIRVSAISATSISVQVNVTAASATGGAEVTLHVNVDVS